MVGFEYEKTGLARIREQLRKMTDEELIRYGREVKQIDAPHLVSGRPVTWWKSCLKLASQEWRRRHHNK